MYSIRYLNEIKLRFSYLFFSFLLSFLVLWFFSDQVLYFCCLPLRKSYLYHYGSSYEPHFLFTEVYEPFLTRLLITSFISSYCCFFFFFYQFWCYMENSLFFYERSIFFQYFLLSFFLFFLSNFLFFYFIFPLICNFFISLEVTNNFLDLETKSNIQIHLETKLYPYICFLIKTNFWFNFFFQFPLIFNFFIYLKWLGWKDLIRWRKFFHFFSIILCTFISIDLFSQIFLFLVFFLLYEFLIFYYIWFFNKSNW